MRSFQRAETQAFLASWRAELWNDVSKHILGAQDTSGNQVDQSRTEIGCKRDKRLQGSGPRMATLHRIQIQHDTDTQQLSWGPQAVNRRLATA